MDDTSTAKRIGSDTTVYLRGLAERRKVDQGKARNEWEATRDRIFKYVNEDLKAEGRPELTMGRFMGKLAIYLGKGLNQKQTFFRLTKLEGLCKEAHRSGYGYKHRFNVEVKVARMEAGASRTPASPSGTVGRTV